MNIFVTKWKRTIKKKRIAFNAQHLRARMSSKPLRITQLRDLHVRQRSWSWLTTFPPSICNLSKRRFQKKIYIYIQTARTQFPLIHSGANNKYINVEADFIMESRRSITIDHDVSRVKIEAALSRGTSKKKRMIGMFVLYFCAKIYSTYARMFNRLKDIVPSLDFDDALAIRLVFIGHFAGGADTISAQQSTKVRGLLYRGSDSVGYRCRADTIHPRYRPVSHRRVWAFRISNCHREKKLVLDSINWKLFVSVLFKSIFSTNSAEIAHTNRALDLALYNVSDPLLFLVLSSCRAEKWIFRFIWRSNRLASAVRFTLHTGCIQPVASITACQVLGRRYSPSLCVCVCLFFFS